MISIAGRPGPPRGGCSLRRPSRVFSIIVSHYPPRVLQPGAAPAPGDPNHCAMAGRNTITLKELAAAIGISEDTLRRRVRDWGLELCYCAATRRPVQFFRDQASEALLKLKVISKPL